MSPGKRCSIRQGDQPHHPLRLRGWVLAPSGPVPQGPQSVQVAETDAAWGPGCAQTLWGDAGTCSSASLVSASPGLPWTGPSGPSGSVSSVPGPSWGSESGLRCSSSRQTPAGVSSSPPWLPKVYWRGLWRGGGGNPIDRRSFDHFESLPVSKPQFPHL